VPGELVHFTRDDVLAVTREADAWEGSQEFEHDVHGVRTHTATLRALAAKLELVLLLEGGEGLPQRRVTEPRGVRRPAAAP
jgi:hypothetical protein